MTSGDPFALRLLSQAYAQVNAETATSDTLLINEQSRLREAQGERVFKFGFGQSPFPVFAPAIERLATRAASKAYLPVQGLPALRARVAAFHQALDGSEWDPDRVVIGPGSKLLIFALMRALPPSTEVLIPAPAWVSYAPQARLAHREVTRLEAGYATRWQLSPQRLDDHCQAGGSRPRLLILNTPSNPTGLSPDSTLQGEIADVARRHGVIVLSDEIYGPLDHRSAHRAFALDYPEGTVTTSGLSKWCGAGGWRLGVMHLPLSLGSTVLSEVIGIASETWSSVTSPVQEAACVAYELTDSLRGYLEDQRRWLSVIGLWCAKSLSAHEVRVHSPDGGFYLYPDFEAYRERLARKGIKTSGDLTAHILSEAGVALLPGSAFGCPTDQLTARLAYVDFEGEALLQRPPPEPTLDLSSIEELQHLCAGIRSLCQWISKL